MKRLVCILFCLSILQVTPAFARLAALSVSSPAFENQGFIPPRHTCDGDNVNPQLDWFNVPPGTRSFALIVEDPDAQVGTWDHWILFNIPPDVDAIPEGTLSLPGNTIQGRNSWGRLGYSGPCPPSGIHRYVFRVFALNKMLFLRSYASKKELLRAMRGHILAEGYLMGRYSARTVD